MRTRLAAVAALAGSLALATAAPAGAASTPSAPLDCGSSTVQVTGFGRGQVLHVVGTNSVFVVTRAQITSGPRSGLVVFDNPGLADAADVVDCTATSPVTATSFSFRGFFTPRR